MCAYVRADERADMCALLMCARAYACMTYKRTITVKKYTDTRIQHAVCNIYIYIPEGG